MLNTYNTEKIKKTATDHRIPVSDSEFDKLIQCLLLPVITVMPLNPYTYLRYRHPRVNNYHNKFPLKVLESSGDNLFPLLKDIKIFLLIQAAKQNVVFLD